MGSIQRLKNCMGSTNKGWFSKVRNIIKFCNLMQTSAKPILGHTSDPRKENKITIAYFYVISKFFISTSFIKNHFCFCFSVAYLVGEAASASVSWTSLALTSQSFSASFMSAAFFFTV